MAHRASTSSTGSENGSSFQEFRQHSDLCGSKQHGGPSLLLYRKLSSDSGKETLVDGNGSYSGDLSCTPGSRERLDPDAFTGKGIEEIGATVSPVSGKSLEGSPCQLDFSGEALDRCRDRPGRIDCPSTNQQHVRRSSLPMTRLTFNKVNHPV